MRILITGAAGFIGSNLAHWILDNTEHDVFGLDNLSTGCQDNMPIHHPRFNYVIGEIVDNLYLINGADVCFHLAAYAAEARSNRIREFIHKNNTLGTAAVINACVKYKCKLVFTSSVAVYSGKNPFDEQTLPSPIDEYGLSKYLSERSIQIAGEQGLDWCIVRPRNVYGPKQSLWDAARNVMGIWMNQIKNGEAMTIIGSGDHKRQFTYIDDIMKPIFNAHAANGIFNLGAQREHTILSAAKTLMNITGHDRIKFLPEREEVADAICEVGKSLRLGFDYENQTTLEDGLKKCGHGQKNNQPGHKHHYQNMKYENNPATFWYW